MLVKELYILRLGAQASHYHDCCTMYGFVVLHLSSADFGHPVSKTCGVLDCLLLCLQDSFAELKVKEIKNGR